MGREMTETSKKRGRPKKEISAATLAKIERLAGLGTRLDEIAIACDVSSSTLDRWLKDEAVNLAYKKGRIEATANVAERLYDLAMMGDVAAAIFWLKAQAGWSDRPQVEVENHAAKVTVYIPDNGR